MNDAPRASRSAIDSRRVVVTALGFTQILGYGTSFYLLAVLAAPMTKDTGWSLAEVAAGISIGLLAGGLSAPWIGRFVDRFGGRPVLAFGSICFAMGLAGIGLSRNLPSYWLAWCVVGLGMASGLYDAAFSALGRWYRQEARPLITSVTLWGGFASTLLWPLSAYLVENVGWRSTCLIYAAAHLVVALPLHIFLMPPNGSAMTQAATETRESYPIVHRRLLFVLISASMMLSSIIVTLISVHLIPVLQGFGYTAVAAVSVGALIGPSQVVGRFAEFAIGKRVHPLWTTLTAGLMMAIGTAMLTFSAPLAAIAIVIYAVGAGVSYIVRGTLPLVLFGSDGYATLMGRLVVPSLIAQALAPWATALSLEHWGTSIFFPTLMALALANIIVVAAMLKSR